MNKLKKIEHGIKALVFRLLQPLLKKNRGDFAPLDGNTINKVLFLRPEKLGDMIISFPVFDGLKARFPHIKIGILGSPKNEVIISDDPRFDKVFLYRKHILRDIQTIRAIRREGYDCVVDMICNDSVTAVILAHLTAPGKPRIGVGKVKYRDYYDCNYDHRQGNTGHIIDNTLKLLAAFAIDPKTVSGYAPPYVAETYFDDAERYFAQLGNDTLPKKTIGYNLSAGSPTRVWPEEKSLRLVQELLAGRNDIRVVLFTVPGERQRAEKIEQQFDEQVHVIPNNLGLQAVSALISKLDLLISPDTSLIHIARSFRVPVVGLYTKYMKNFLLWKPYGQETGSVVSDDDDNIHSIPVDAVVAMVWNVLTEPSLVRGK